MSLSYFYQEVSLNMLLLLILTHMLVSLLVVDLLLGGLDCFAADFFVVVLHLDQLAQAFL